MLPSGKFFRKNIAISPDFVYTGRRIGHSSLRRKQVSSPPVQPHPAASRRGRQFCLPRLFLLFFYSAGIRIFSVVIAPYFRSPGSAIVPVPAPSALLPNRLLHFSGFFDWPDIPPFPTLSSAWIPPFPGAAIVPVPALSAPLPNRLLHFSDFFDRPDIPPFPTLSSAWIPPFPGAAIISALASFRCRSYAGIFSFPESIAVRRLKVFSLPVFRFWISERAAFLPLDFCAVVFSVCIRRFCPVTTPFSDLGASRFLSSFCPALDTFLSSRRWCLSY